MMYAFARDGGIPGHKFFAKVSSNWKSPIRTGLSFGIIAFVLISAGDPGWKTWRGVSNFDIC